MLRSWIAGHSRKPFSGCSMGKSVMEEDVMKNVRCCGAQIHLKKLIFCLDNPDHLIWYPETLRILHCD